MKFFFTNSEDGLLHLGPLGLWNYVAYSSQKKKSG